MNENELKKQKEHQAKLNKEVLATLEKQVSERDALVEDAGRVAEDIEDNQFLALMLQEYDFSNSDVNLIIKAFKKVWSRIDQLK